MCPTDQTTTSATTARPRTTLWAAELKSAPIDFVMLSPSLACSAKLGSRPAGVKRRFKINAASPMTSTHPRLRYVGRLTHVAGLPEAYTFPRLCSGEHCAGGARECTRHDSVVALEAWQSRPGVRACCRSRK